MNSADPTHRIQPEVRAAISAFLNEVQRDPKPFALSEALAAIRQIFPELEISDADLADAIASEALSAGVGIEFDVLKTRKALERRAIERWENEGGTSGRKKNSDRAQSDAAQRAKTNDTNGRRRRANESKERHRLI
ncbi:MAG: hypothetical protein E5Y65_31460 [Mesorhizobium sp.]|jgi:hypothetical protein|uniref:hypothetical protein n=1 Tax=Mesorhizobium sp. TaxID=1871066 RepID=UPI000FEA6E78|nr:hypothetical protein [Mesorhizobium sp.]RWK60933.1 MAG: hypothetical protein EOR49_19425 [Mesorhizobium sp.]RWM46537.1 MAG: hypothetical protein EOR76_18100 [Mesorhizobium sp.]RWM50418.1 MAG: hypothetical protein EOR78_25865 [Mesorhizobium sp.]RWM55493.1 MAG: hypothetical protein EOR79_21300 [Mesorhizobium sp.]RWM77517.1 MAG: hypothetical protein EOR81_17305 [Mesorhizobium sp.]